MKMHSSQCSMITERATHIAIRSKQKIECTVCVFIQCKLVFKHLMAKTSELLGTYFDRCKIVFCFVSFVRFGTQNEMKFTSNVGTVKRK